MMINSVAFGLAVMLVNIGAQEWGANPFDSFFISMAMVVGYLWGATYARMSS